MNWGDPFRGKEAVDRKVLDPWPVAIFHCFLEFLIGHRRLCLPSVSICRFFLVLAVTFVPRTRKIASGERDSYRAGSPSNGRPDHTQHTSSRKIAVVPSSGLPSWSPTVMPHTCHATGPSMGCKNLGPGLGRRGERRKWVCGVFAGPCMQPITVDCKVGTIRPS